MFRPRAHRITLLAATIGVAALGLGATTATQAAQAAESTAAVPVKIMPLGASMTYGTGSTTGNGYREVLRQQLTGAGVSIDYVGSLKSGTTDDPENEGHGGYRIDQVAAGAENWLATYTPDVVLLAAGTNDTLQNYDLPNAPARLSALIDEILAARPGVTLVVGTLQPSGNAANDAEVDEFNAAAKTLVEQKIADGTDGLHLADLNAVLNSSDLTSDGIHPNDGGYSKIAGAWFEALEPILAATGD
ncbi:SGNH/GDSL hydrolase family protein [Kineosporia mesophila]|uniref:SGNH/GDSL hydrolase family protein n=1 Tax=Kineosporia mesophila TaxID=566012 RepID=A0ABP6Z9V8_9ACTN|nr:SGNH/GDSL hydrolase family protein [Kineosporia mesophila]MCD5352078.1 SGNH/GDSL hydrolase family protein [Kineosporia mesophila]